MGNVIGELMEEVGVGRRKCGRKWVGRGRASISTPNVNLYSPSENWQRTGNISVSLFVSRSPSPFIVRLPSGPSEGT